MALKGLQALIPKKSQKGEKRKKEAVFWLEIKKIKPNPFQPRKKFDKKSLKELARSIEKYGLLQPIIVRKIEKETKSGEKVEYQLIAGERRLKAAKMVGMREIPAIIQDVKKEDELPLSLVENLQREDLNPIEKALAFKKLSEEFHLTQKEISQIVGKSREAIANTIRLLELEDEIKEALEKGKISEGHGKALLSLPKDQRLKVFKKILEKNLSVREVEKIASKSKTQRKKTSTKIISPYRSWIEEEKKKFGIEKIKAKKEKKSYILNFLFSSKENLEKFLKTLKKIG